MSLRHAHAHADRSGAEAEAAPGPDRRTQRRRLGWILSLSATTMLAEVVGGWWSGSLALLADAGHMASDVAALALAMAALWIAQQPGGERRTFGNARAEILAAWLQGLALVGVALFIVVEAFERLEEPREILAPVMLGVAAVGLAVNLAGLTLLGTHRHESLNIRGAWLHVLSDTLGSVGAMLAGGAVWVFGWTWADPAVSLGIAGLILASSWPLLRDAADVLMEASPRDLDLEELRSALVATPGVDALHELHVWRIGHGDVSLSCHLVLSGQHDSARVLKRVRERLRREFAISHTTLQLESGSGADDCGDDCPLQPLP